MMGQSSCDGMPDPYAESPALDRKSAFVHSSFLLVGSLSKKLDRFYYSSADVTGLCIIIEVYILNQT